ncbi:LCP family protein [Cryptosporangium arvum]|uniref:LCP family protein n=1 Tax=Cryptosporangium arvum TaxID=80871 RepID=UPI0005684BC4|nr:LCP family protein [Cryptosporangium arvum]
MWRGAPRWMWLAVAIGALLTIFSAGVLVGLPAAVDHYTGDITRKGGLGDAADQGHSIDGPLNLLLIGTDERPDAPDNIRADSIIVVHVNADHTKAYLASIPRDSLVDIPEFPDTRYPGGQDKINAAFQFGFRSGGGKSKGMELLANTVSDLAGGMKFDGAAIINFEGLRGVVRALGGVRMCVDEKVTSIHVGWNTQTGEVGVPYYINDDGTPAGRRENMRPQVYWPGCHEFKDWQALDYARQRDLLANNDGDYGRQRHQQQLIKAIMQKATSGGVISSPTKISKVLGSLGDALTFYNNDVSITDWVFTLKGIKPDQLTMVKTNGGKFNAEVVNGIWYERLSDTSMDLLRAMNDDRMDDFVAANPTWVTPTT